MVFFTFWSFSCKYCWVTRFYDIKLSLWVSTVWSVKYIVVLGLINFSFRWLRINDGWWLAYRGMVGGDMMMRGDPRGISGRLNGGAAEGMWPGQPPHHMPPNKPGAWPGGPPPGKDKPNGWEEPSPPQQRRNIPNYDDGTSLWGGGPQPPRPAMPG